MDGVAVCACATLCIVLCVLALSLCCHAPRAYTPCYHERMHYCHDWVHASVYVCVRASCSAHTASLLACARHTHSSCVCIYTDGWPLMCFSVWRVNLQWWLNHTHTRNASGPCRHCCHAQRKTHTHTYTHTHAHKRTQAHAHTHVNACLLQAVLCMAASCRLEQLGITSRSTNGQDWHKVVYVCEHVCVSMCVCVCVCSFSIHADKRTKEELQDAQQGLPAPIPGQR